MTVNYILMFIRKFYNKLYLLRYILKVVKYNLMTLRFQVNDVCEYKKKKSKNLKVKIIAI